MPTRMLSADGRTWRVFPSGFVTPYTADEFGLIFVTGDGDDREVRVTRFSPVGTRSREAALAEMSDEQLAGLLAQVALHVRGVYMWGLLVLATAYVLRGVGDVTNTWVTWLSPLGWAGKAAPFGDMRWWTLVIPVVVGLATRLMSSW